jgi:hypothetical protein
VFQSQPQTKNVFIDGVLLFAFHTEHLPARSI